ncbi:MAG: hypothetical protein AAFX56_06440 [Pseudomonadota bacterium]
MKIRLSLFAVLLLSLAACGGGGSDNGSVPPPAEPEALVWGQGNWDSAEWQ